jgi:hypothetical protein
MEPTAKSKNSPQTIIGIIVGLIVMVLIQQLFIKNPGFDKAMMKAASELNKTCPVMVDRETQLDNAIALPDKVFQYNYTLVNIGKDSIDIQSFENYMKPMLLNKVKNAPELKMYRDNKVTMAYSYKDKDGVFLTKILITSSDYSK